MDVARVYDIPADLATGFEEFDYFDLFAATSPEALSRSPEHWARATMEGANRAGRFLAWQTVLRLRLRLADTADSIAGWQVIERTESSIVMSATSWCMTAHAVFHVAPDRVSFGVFVTYHRPAGRLIWGTMVSAVHRTLAPGFLAAGVRRVEVAA